MKVTDILESSIQIRSYWVRVLFYYKGYRYELNKNNSPSNIKDYGAYDCAVTRNDELLASKTHLENNL